MENAPIKRGQIRFIKIPYATGCEQRNDRPGVIVSNNKNNQHSGTVEVVYLTQAQKKDMPTHVTVRDGVRRSTALAEQIHTVDVSRVGTLLGYVTDQEMQALNISMQISLGIQDEQPTAQKDDAYIRLECERDLYRKLYTDLLVKVVQ